MTEEAISRGPRKLAARPVLSYEAGRDLARAVLLRAFVDATTATPDWPAAAHAAEARAARQDALHFLLSPSPDAAQMRRLWYTLAERPEPPRERVIAILERHAKGGIPRPGRERAEVRRAAKEELPCAAV